MERSFRGGIYPEGKRETAKRPLEEMGAGDFVTIPLSQNKGAPAILTVSVGDRVWKGQCVGKAAEGISCPVHSSVSGRVHSIEWDPEGVARSVTLANDHLDQIDPALRAYDKPLSRSEPEDLISYVKEKGIVGQGGAGFPTWYKIAAAVGTGVDTLIINAAESEPYLTCNCRILWEKSDEVLGGATVLFRACGAKRLILAVEHHQRAAVKKISQKLMGKTTAQVVFFKDSYPQGDEKNLVRVLLRREIPPGKTPLSLGAVVFSVQTCVSVCRAFVSGMPAVDRYLTVSGDCIRTPSNLQVPVGVSFQEVIDRCGGFARTPRQILSGGVMMGTVQETTRVPVTKSTLAILAMADQEEAARTECIRCGRCLKACPMRLVPGELYRSVKKGSWKRARRYRIDLCTRCGCCTYVCPAKIDLSETIRRGKDLIPKADREN